MPVIDDPQPGRPAHDGARKPRTPRSRRQQSVKKAQGMMAKSRKQVVVHVKAKSTVGVERKPVVPSLAAHLASARGTATMDLDAGGLTAVLLDLVGEGNVTLGHALGAWQREQDRLANRGWRRPGGLARFPGIF